MSKLSLILAFVLFASCKYSKQGYMNENEKLINQYFDHFNNHRWQEMSDMYAKDAKFKDPSLGQGILTQTKQEIIDKYADLSRIFPDLRDEVIQVYPSGDRHVIVEFVSKGTADDGSTFELPICTIFTIEGGKITGDFTYYDNFDEQAGEMP